MGDDLFAEMAQGLILGPQAGTPASDPFRLPQAYPPQVPPCSFNPVKGPMVVSLPDNVVPCHIALLFSLSGMRSQPLLHGMVHSGKGALPACCSTVVGCTAFPLFRQRQTSAQESVVHALTPVASHDAGSTSLCAVPAQHQRLRRLPVPGAGLCGALTALCVTGVCFKERQSACFDFS